MEKICSSYSEAVKKHGKVVAKILFQRLNELRSASSVDDLVKNRIGRCHSLAGDRIGQFAMDLGHPHRLIFTVEIKTSVVIIEIVDYH
ncbi:MAG: hypothetical protein PUA61_01940 [Succinatimonas hippei]|nr:hypothetical protein [Succinatimonas hippei]